MTEHGLPARPVIRPVRWPADEAGIARIDTSFETDAVLSIERDGLSYLVSEQRISPRYERPPHQLDLDELRSADALFVADINGGVVGICGLRCERWSKRGVVANIYVHKPVRGRGAGHGLITAVAEAARAAGMNRLWAETQDVNLPAVRFYQREGFAFCGLDESFYDPTTPAGKEVAVFFVKSLG